MVITSPRTGRLRDNIIVASWKLGALWEIFLSKKFFSNEIYLFITYKIKFFFFYSKNYCM